MSDLYLSLNAATNAKKIAQLRLRLRLRKKAENAAPFQDRDRLAQLSGDGEMVGILSKANMQQVQ